MFVQVPLPILQTPAPFAMTLYPLMKQRMLELLFEETGRKTIQKNEKMAMIQMVMAVLTA